MDRVDREDSNIQLGGTHVEGSVIFADIVGWDCLRSKQTSSVKPFATRYFLTNAGNKENGDHESRRSNRDEVRSF